jgi:hypothetical protein
LLDLKQAPRQSPGTKYFQATKCIVLPPSHCRQFEFKQEESSLDNYYVVTESALFVKKLLAVAISNVAYLRGLFNEAAFGGKTLDNLAATAYLNDLTNF